MNKATTLLGAAAATVAFCADAQQFAATSEPVVVAAELFGGEVRLVFDDDAPFQPIVALTLEHARTIDYGTTFTVGFHLVNARFARAVSVDDAQWVRVAPGPGGTAPIRRPVNDEAEVTRTGGPRGANSVRFNVSLDQLHGLRDLHYADGVWHGEQRGLDFRIPDLIVAGLGRTPPEAALVRITVEQPGRFPVGTDIVEGLADPLCGRTPYPAVLEGCALVRAEPAVPALANTPGPPVAISPRTGTRHMLVAADGAPLAAQQAVLTEMAPALARYPPVRDAGGTVVEAFAGDLSGDLVVVVASEHFRSGDTVFADADGDGRAGPGETFALQGRTAAYTGVPTAEPLRIIYVPNGTNPLHHGATFTTSARIDFDRAGNRDVVFPPSTFALHIHGIAPGGLRAYGIPPPTSSDTGNLRVTCESSADRCRVLLQCRDREGVGMFGDAGTVPPGATARWNQAQVADVLGGPWAGRLSCEVLSDGPIGVQVLTRADGVLVNNTTVAAQ